MVHASSSVGRLVPLAGLGAILMCLWPASGFANSTQPSGAELERALERLGVVGNVLYVAAHPDDENTRLLAYFANEKLLRTGYLSLTRGEGGQNLIGAEQAPLLGVIRTQELLAARAIDAAEQFFTRARDFGYSKTLKETLAIWGRDEVLADMVWVIRRFHPDVIVTRFSPADHETHGHHTASADLAVAAFRAAADPQFHPEQLKYVTPWQARRVVWNDGRWDPKAGEDVSGLASLDAGGYNPVLGKSYGEIAAASRSMHKSQGFGAAPSRGVRLEYFKLLDGEPMKHSPLDGVDASWARVPHAEALMAAIKRAREQFRVSAPQAILPRLYEVAAALDALPDNPYRAQKRAELDEVIAACAGLFTEAYAKQPSSVPGGELAVTAVAINRSPASLKLREVRFAQGAPLPVNKPLIANEPMQLGRGITLPSEIEYANPYWLIDPPAGGLFTARDRSLIGLPEQPSPLEVEWVIAAGDRTLTIKRPIQYKWTDPVAGERRRAVEVLPPLTLHPAAPLLMFPDAHARELKVTVTAGLAAVAGNVQLELPSGWHAEPASRPFSLTPGAVAEVGFTVRPPAAAASGSLRAVAEVDGKRVARDVLRIEYPHIPIQTLTPEASVKLVRFDFQRKGTRIGYIPGAGDEVPQALRQVGYEVTPLSNEALAQQPLDHFDAIVVGVRAFNTNARLPAYHQRLMAYVAGGGTLLVQYNTKNWISNVPAEIGPYPFSIAWDRVTDETAPVTMAPHALLRGPNSISAHDFEGWVQERGLYFAESWDPRYETPLTMNDPGEAPKKGSLLIAHYQKGVFIYTGLAFFRQLPAGVPGAFRLFANLIAHAGKR
jgi:LmbE family N-acetylglucosaminyl deacetylase